MRAHTSDPTTLAHSLNVLRTHYSASQRAIFAAGQANATKSDAVRMRKDRTPYNGELPVVTVGEAAQRAGVDPGTIQKAKRILREGAPELVHAVKAGKLTLHAAGCVIAEDPDPKAQAAMRRQRKSPGGSPGPGSSPEFDSSHQVSKQTC